MTAPDFRPLGFGEILDGAFSLYRRNLVTFLVTAIVPMVVMAVIFFVFGEAYFNAALRGDPAAMLSALGSFFLGLLLSTLVYAVLCGVFTRQAAQSCLGQPASVGDGMRTGLRKLLPIIGAVLVISIGLLAAFFAVGMVVGVIGALAGSTGSVVVTMIVGLVTFLGMGAASLMAMAMFFAVLPAIVVEDKGAFQAIGRSFDLARGALGRIVGLMLVTLLITYLPMLAVLIVAGSFANMGDPNALPSTGQFLTQQVLALGVGVLATPFLVAVIVLQYFDRRVRTEALDVQMAAERLAVAGS
jgi:hypothetical protein